MRGSNMSSAHRMRVSRTLKPAAVDGVLGLAGSIVPTAKASLVTLQLVPTSVTGGTAVGQNVTMTGAGTVNFNVVTVIHGTNGSAADDGMQNFGFSITSDSG